MAMGSNLESLGLRSAAVPLLRDLVHERVGIFYEDGRLDVLAERLGALVIERGFESFLDYYYLLKYDEEAADEWGRVMDALSVPETYFWREMDQLRAVVDAVLPALAASRRNPVRIWHVPCASGEEPLSMAMALEEAGWFDRAAIEIHGSDASPAQVARARTGRFRERSFRALPPGLRERYFRQDGEAWVPAETLRARVTSWSVVNLLEEADVRLYADAPIIFCRNVFIYFSQERIRQVVERFADAMPSPGYLFVGASESLLRTTERFSLEEVGGAFVYVKR
jgi:chemotaxis protein methyltransferase CheR